MRSATAAAAATGHAHSGQATGGCGRRGRLEPRGVAHARCRRSRRCRQSLEADVGAVEVEVVVVDAGELHAATGAGPQGDVRLDLLPRPVHVLRHAGDLEHGLLVPAGCHDVGVGLLLNAFDGCP